jgi:PKHD-type hydroxylase
MYYQQPTNDPLNYYYYKNTFTVDEIKKITSMLESLEYQKATTFLETDNNVRVSKIKWIPKTEEWNWVYQRLMEIALEANQKMWHFDIFNCEQIQYTEYHQDVEGHYDWHQDLGAGEPSHRKISISVQLSEPSTYAGGDLQFWFGGADDNQTVSVKKALGEATIFPSYMMHRVTNVYWGTRKSLVIWIGGSHFR